MQDVLVLTLLTAIIDVIVAELSPWDLAYLENLGELPRPEVTSSPTEPFFSPEPEPIEPPLFTYESPPKVASSSTGTSRTTPWTTTTLTTTHLITTPTTTIRTSPLTAHITRTPLNSNRYYMKTSATSKSQPAVYYQRSTRPTTFRTTTRENVNQPLFSLEELLLKLGLAVKSPDSRSTITNQNVAAPQQNQNKITVETSNTIAGGLQSPNMCKDSSRRINGFCTSDFYNLDTRKMLCAKTCNIC